MADFGSVVTGLVVVGTLLLLRGDASSMERHNFRFCERICLRYSLASVERRQRAPNIELQARNILLERTCHCLDQTDKLRHRRSDVGDSTSSSNSTATTAESHKTWDYPAGDRDAEERGGCAPSKVSANFMKKHISAEVDFSQVNKTWQARVTWKPVTGSDLELLQFYRVMWSDKEQDFAQCRSVPKNKTETIIMSSKGWNYPNRLLLSVTPMPQDGKRNALESFDPKIHPAPQELETAKNTVTLILSISGGIVAGLLLLFVALWYRTMMKAKYPRYGPRPQKSSQDDSLYLVSYYPESDEYVSKVVHLVGWFRSRGYDMVMDKMATTEISSLGPERWTGREMSRARKVLVLCSRTYIELCIDRGEALGRYATQTDKRVLYEVGLLADHYFHTLSASKMVCVLMGDSIPVKDVPLWMRVTYRWPDDCKSILHRLNDKNEFEAVV